MKQSGQLEERWMKTGRWRRVDSSVFPRLTDSCLFLMVCVSSSPVEALHERPRAHHQPRPPRAAFLLEGVGAVLCSRLQPHNEETRVCPTHAGTFTPCLCFCWHNWDLFVSGQSSSAPAGCWRRWTKWIRWTTRCRWSCRWAKLSEHLNFLPPHFLFDSLCILLFVNRKRAETWRRANAWSKCCRRRCQPWGRSSERDSRANQEKVSDYFI